MIFFRTYKEITTKASTNRYFSRKNQENSEIKKILVCSKMFVVFLSGRRPLKLRLLKREKWACFGRTTKKYRRHENFATRKEEESFDLSSATYFSSSTTWHPRLVRSSAPVSPRKSPQYVSPCLRFIRISSNTVSGWSRLIRRNFSRHAIFFLEIFHVFQYSSECFHILQQGN